MELKPLTFFSICQIPTNFHKLFKTIMMCSALFSNGCLTSGAKSISENDSIESIPIESVSEVDWKIFFRAPPTLVEKNSLQKGIIVSKDTGKPTTLLMAARKAIAIGKFREAEANIKALIRKDPDHIEGLLELCNLYLKLDQNFDAQTVMSDIENIVSKKSDLVSNISKVNLLKIRYLKALVLMSQDMRQEGRKVLSEIIGEIPTFSPAYAALAQSYILQNNLQLAEFVTDRALDRIKNDPEIFNLAGMVASSKGEYDRAIEMFEEALSHHKEYVPALVNRANLNIELGQFASAEEDLKTAEKLEPHSADVIVSLGNLYLKQSDINRARQSYELALEIKPNHTFARFNLAMILLKHFKNQEEARQLLNEVIQITSTPNSLKFQAEKHLSRISNLQSG